MMTVVGVDTARSHIQPFPDPNERLGGSLSWGTETAGEERAIAHAGV
jgi:hypothetical protein